VLYLIKRDVNNSANDRVLSLCKLKTLEYRLFRKMREKLRGYFRNKKKGEKDPYKLTKAFTTEAKKLAED